MAVAPDGDVGDPGVDRLRHSPVGHPAERDGERGGDNGLQSGGRHHASGGDADPERDLRPHGNGHLHADDRHDHGKCDREHDHDHDRTHGECDQLRADARLLDLEWWRRQCRRQLRLHDADDRTLGGHRVAGRDFHAN